MKPRNWAKLLGIHLHTRHPCRGYAYTYVFTVCVPVPYKQHDRVVCSPPANDAWSCFQLHMSVRLSVCLSVCLFVCLCVCLSVCDALALESLDLESLFLLCNTSSEYPVEVRISGSSVVTCQGHGGKKRVSFLFVGGLLSSERKSHSSIVEVYCFHGRL